MKIAFFTSGTLPVPAVQGGAVENLIDELLQYNDYHQLHDITIYSITPKFPLQESPDTSCNHYVFIDDHSFWFKLKRRIFARLNWRQFYYNYFVEFYFHEALRRFNREHYDIAILENRPGFAKRIKECSDTKVISHLHYDWLSHDENTKLVSQLQACDKIITVSDFIKNQISCVTSEINISTVYNGIDTKQFYQAKPKDRTTFGFKQDDVILVYSGRIYPDKGVAELIEAFLRLKENKHLKLMIIGDSIFGNNSHFDPYIERLKTMAEEVVGRIIFTGFVSYKEIPSYLKMSDIAVVPSLCNEAFSMAVLEAMACGLPLIASRIGGIPEPAGIDNILVDTDSQFVDHLYDAIVTLTNDVNLRHQIGNSNIVRSSKFDKSVFAKNFYDCISC